MVDDDIHGMYQLDGNEWYLKERNTAQNSTKLWYSSVVSLCVVVLIGVLQVWYFGYTVFLPPPLCQQVSLPSGPLGTLVMSGIWGTWGIWDTWAEASRPSPPLPSEGEEGVAVAWAVSAPSPPPPNSSTAGKSPQKGIPFNFVFPFLFLFQPRLSFCDGPTSGLSFQFLYADVCLWAVSGLDSIQLPWGVGPLGVCILLKSQMVHVVQK